MCWPCSSRNMSDNNEDEDQQHEAEEEEEQQEEEEQEGENEEQEEEEQQQEDEAVEDEQVLQIDPSVKFYSASLSTEEDARQVIKILANNTHLTRLHLECGATFRDHQACAEDLASAVAAAPLTFLRLAWYKFGGSSSMASCLIRAAHVSTTILHLEVYSVEDAGMEEIALCLTHLETLTLEGKFMPDNIEVLREGLQTTSTLTTLELSDISGLDFTEDFRNLSQAIASNASLTTLRLASCAMNDNDMNAFLQHWHHDSQIQTLSLTNTGIEVESAMLLIQAASAHPAMESLSIERNWRVGYEGLAIIAMELPNVVLKYLSLASCAYSEHENDDTNRNEASAVVGGLIAQGMRANTHLIELDVSGNGFETLAGQAVQEELVFYKLRNKFSVLMLLESQLPTTVWCYAFAQHGQNASFIFFFLQEQPILWPECQHLAKKRRIEES